MWFVNAAVCYCVYPSVHVYMRNWCEKIDSTKIYYQNSSVLQVLTQIDEKNNAEVYVWQIEWNRIDWTKQEFMIG